MDNKSKINQRVLNFIKDHKLICVFNNPKSGYRGDWLYEYPDGSIIVGFRIFEIVREKLLEDQAWEVKMIQMKALIKRRNRGLENFPVENSDCPPAEDFLAGTKF